MGHIGLTPQTYSSLGGYRVQGRTADEAAKLLEDALALEAAGCFAVVLEMVPAAVASAITSRLRVPTIGIGAGSGTSGQVQVFHDLLGLYDQKVPKFSKQFVHLEAPITSALSAYAQAVEQRAFPEDGTHTFRIAPDELASFLDGSSGVQPPSVRGNVAVAPVRTERTKGAATQRMRIGSSRPPHIIRSIAEWRELQASSKAAHTSLGLVPTMGALHAGHLSLVARAKRENEQVAASIFVNPRQFAPGEDLDTYPRTWASDLNALTECGVDYVFAPSVDDMYPPHRSPVLMPYVDLIGADEQAEGASRPGFFRGVGTVVTKLLNILQPDAVYFGQKDGMQCIVVRRLIEDLNFNVRMVVGETVREEDGLAMSSRNVYLAPEERAVAPNVYKALARVQERFSLGERDVTKLHACAAGVVSGVPSMSLDYFSLASMEDGQEISAVCSPTGEEGVLASIAVRLGRTRLIDNIVLKPEK